MFLRNRAKQEQIKSAFRRRSGAFATWQAAGGKAPQPPARRWGRSWASRPSRCAVAAAASLDPHPLRQCPPPLRGPLARFSSEGRVKGLVRPADPAGARTRPLDATGATQACRQGVGALFPGTPALGESPRQAAGGACKACGAGGTPAGVPRGAQPLGHSAANKTLCRRQAFPALRASLLAFSSGPKRGLIYRYRRGRGES